MLVRAKPLGQAEELGTRLVEEVQLVDDALVLAADAAWSELSTTVLVKKGVTVDDLRSAASSPDVRQGPRPLHHLSRLGRRLGRRLGSLQESCASPFFQV